MPKKELPPQQKAAIEYNRRINDKEFTYPEALRDKSVYDVLIMPEFAAILTAYINEQVETRKKVVETIVKLKEQGKGSAEIALSGSARCWCSPPDNPDNLTSVLPPLTMHPG